MIQDEIIEMAREVGMEQDGDMWFSNLYKTDMDVHISHLEAFAKLIAAKEREACAKLCDARAIEYDGFTEEQNASEKLASAIRARGEA
jgi:hypothetical protein